MELEQTLAVSSEIVKCQRALERLGETLTDSGGSSFQIRAVLNSLQAVNQLALTLRAVERREAIEATTLQPNTDRT